MKKILFALLSVFVFVSCSKDSDESDIIPSDGQYVGRTEYVDEYNNFSNTFCITIANGLCTDFVIYSGAERFNYYRPADISTKGSYPKYTYRINDFTVQARFTDLENFTANLAGVLHTHKDDARTLVGEIHGSIALEATDIHFKLDKTPLDADNNGILDSKQ